MRHLIVASISLGVLAACSSTSGGGAPIIPDKTIQWTAKTAISMSKLVNIGLAGAAIYMVYDPLAPNWEIEEAKLGADTYRFSMKMKRYHTGGAGESMQAMKRRASQLQYELGFSGYQILEYTEGIDSQTLGARRVADGIVRLVNPQQADSFLQN